MLDEAICGNIHLPANAKMLAESEEIVVERDVRGMVNVGPDAVSATAHSVGYWTLKPSSAF